MSDPSAATTHPVTSSGDLFADGPASSSARPAAGLSRRSLLRTIGLGGVAVGVGVATKGFGVGELLGGLGGDPAGASPNACASTSRIGEAKVVCGNLGAVLGSKGPDVLSTSDGGATFSNRTPPALGTFVPYTTGTNGVPGSFGIAGDNGTVMIYDAPTNTWRGAKPGGSSILTGLAGNGSFWVVTATEGKYWYTTNNGASWSSPSNGAYLNYASIASILTVYDLEYANGVWVGCGYDTLGVGRTFWRSTNPNPTRGAKNSWFSVSGGDFAEIKGSGDGNAVSVYAVTYAGHCQPNTWYGCGNFGTVWRSTDNGASWSKWRDSGSEIHYGIDVNPYTGRVLCASGLAGITEVSPGTQQRFSTSKSIYEIAWVGGNDWIAGGDFGQLLVSHNDGLSWAQAAGPGSTQLYNSIAKPW